MTIPTSILILGGGFAGCEAAKKLARARIPDTTIRLMDPKTYFEYHAALYRFATGKSPLEACLPYHDIFEGCDIDVVKDSAVHIDLQSRTVEGKSGSHYHYDILILALGSETSYFDIHGVAEYSFGMKSATEALRLKTHVEEVCEKAIGKNSGKEALLHFVVVGGGASGVELAAELASFTKVLALKYSLNPSIVHIDLIEAAPRILAFLPESVSCLAEARLRQLGVNVILNHSLVQEKGGQIELADASIRTKTVVWTAGMRGNSLVEKTPGFILDRKGRIEVDDCLQAKGVEHVYVLGDLAATKQSGMAQTALYDGSFVADVLLAKARSLKTPSYAPREPVYAVPVGPRWAVVSRNGRVVSGRVGWMLRRSLDLFVFLKLLPFRKALRAFTSLKSST